MYLLPTVRTEILKHLPQNGTAVEIGVCEGNFSQEIITRNNPGKLHLIDPWEHQEREDYQADVNNVANNQQESRFRYVSKRFKSQVAMGQVIIHRDYSTNVAQQFADRSLDWIFIDGLHSYEGVKADLESYQNKIQDDGFILGHDFTNHPGAQSMNFGVIEAVNEFVKDTNFQLLLMTWENFPSYVLCRDPNSKNAQHLLGASIYDCSGAIHLPDFPNGMAFIHESVMLRDKHVLIPSFGLK